MSKKYARSSRTCEICGIREAHLESRLFFANFPLDENRCKEWVRLAGNSDLLYLPIEKLHAIKHICENHFRSKDFNKKRNRLKKRAVPCLNFLRPPLDDDQISEFPVQISKNQEVPVPVMQYEPSKCEKKHEHILPPCSNEASTSGATIESNRAQVFICKPSTSNEGEGHLLPSIIEASTSNVIIEDAKETPKIKLASHSKLDEKAGKCLKRKIAFDQELSPRKKALIEKLNKTKCTLQSLKKSAILLEKIESPVLRELVVNTWKNEKRTPKARRWTTKHKISCLAILKRSRKTYKYLSSAMTLPSIKTLQNVLRKVPMKPGICTAVLNHLKSIAEEMDEKDRVCSLAFDEMALKSRLIYNEADDIVEGFEDLGELGRTNELADHALVFLLQGLRKKKKQPIAFYFTKGTISSGQLAMIIKKIIAEVTECGFTVLNTVCDQGSTNIGALKILRDSEQNNYFSVNGKKVYIMYDVPHLFKSIRNNFLKNGYIILNRKKGNWSHLMEMEKLNRNFLYLSKITEAHVMPKYKAKMRVKLAAQALSNTVSAVLKLLARAETGEKQTALLNTAEVVHELDQLFDVTNGPSGPQDIKKKQRENASEKSNHMERWAYYIKLLSEVKFLNENGVPAKNVKCIEGYITSLKSLREIWVEAHKMGYKYLNLRNINQDALENLFGVIRQHSPTNRNPTVSHFVAALKTAIITGLTAPHSRGSNCEADNKQLLTDFQNFVYGDQTKETSQVATNIKVSVSNSDKDKDDVIPTVHLSDDEDEIEDTDFSLINQQPIVYVAGYLAKTILRNVKCLECEAKLIVKNPTDNETYSYILLREWWAEKFSLTYPSLVFCKTVQSMVSIAENELLPQLSKRNICVLGVTLFTVGVQEDCFQCPEHGEKIKNKCFEKTCKLLVRRQCQRVNVSLSSKEENLASINKRAEQLGTAR